MSGGHWDYCGLRIRRYLEDIARDKRVRGRFTRLSTILLGLGDLLYQIEYDLD